MRLLHVIASLDPAAGGPPAAAIRLAAAQAMEGHDVVLACYEDRAVPAGNAAYERVPGVDRVRCHRFPLPGPWERLTARGAGCRLRPIVADLQVVHLHGVWSPILLAAARIAQRLGVPYVVTPHGMLDPWCLQQKAVKKRFALALSWRRALNRASFMHVLNADEGRLLEPLGLACPVATIPNGVFLDELGDAPSTDFFQSTLGFSGSRAIIFLGRLHHKKGLDYLAGAFDILARRIPDAQLVVAGPDEGAQTGFMSQVDRAGLRRRVHVIGPLYGEQKYAALRSAACFCLPSRQEGFSIAILEALACRLPVVISDACHFPEVAESGAGRVVPLEPEQIAAALLDVLENRDSARRMGAAGLQLVENRFTWNRIADQFVAEYARSVSGTVE